MIDTNRRKFLKISGTVLGLSTLNLSFSNSINERNDALSFEQEIPIEDSYDVVVCGGGPSGCAAALSAVREGLKTLLIESQGQFGGMGTSGHVSHWLGGRINNGKEWVVGGIFREMSEETASLGISLLPTAESFPKYQPHGWYKGLVNGIPFDPFQMAFYLDEKLMKEGVDVLLCSKVVGLDLHNKQINHVIINNKEGFSAIPTKAVIDSTGDADIAFMAGCPTIKGRKEDGLMTPTTLQFHVYNVDQDKLSDYIQKNDTPRFRNLIKDLRKKGIWNFPYEIFISVQLHEKGVMMINTSRLVGFDGTDGKSLTNAMIAGRKETQELFKVMRKYFPGFENSRIKSVAPALGVRETRRIIGNYVLTVEDLVSGKAFDDTIGFTGYGWDLPDPKKPSFQPLHEKKIKKPPVTPIPYRVMIPKAVDNLICPGRAISVERHVLGPMRVMAPCMAMGEAAGTSAKQVVTDRVAFNDINIKQLTTVLKGKGVILD